MNIPFFKLFLATPLVAAILVFSGCGGGGGGVIAGGGIGGTGIGTITGFGSVIINDIREFEIDAETEIFRDGDSITQVELEHPDNKGMVAQVDVGDDVSDDFTSGTAVTINIDNLVKGPVTSTSPLQVLQQTVVVNADTSLLDMGGNVANLMIGDIVEVSGFADSNNVIQVTRMQRKAGGILVWKLTGLVNTVIANTSFRIGNQTVELNGVVPDDCGGALQDGDLVEVKASQIPGFIPGDSLDTVTDVECEVPGLDVPAGATGTIEAEVEGLVTAITTLSDFRINGQRVITTAGTRFEGGAAQDIVLGAKLEAEGTLNTATGILTAEEIEFRETRIRIEAPVQPGDVNTVTGTLTIMTIPVSATSLTEDDDGIFTAGLPGARQIEIKGYVDGAGQLIATEAKDTGAADFNDVRLRGPAEMLVPDVSFDIAGVTVDVATAVSISDERIDPPVSLTPAGFFAAISSGTPVQVEKGTYNPGSETITVGEIEIED